MQRAQSSDNTQKEVILVGEIHEDTSHMSSVAELAKQKLAKQNIVIALEQPEGEFQLIEAAKPVRTNTRPFRGAAAQAVQDPPTIRKRVEKLMQDMNFNDEGKRQDYVDSLTSIAEHAPTLGRDVKFVAVDTLSYDVNEKDPARDKAMRDNIMRLKETCVIYPVGSAHIHDSGNGSKEINRLGSLLLLENKKKSITLKVGNFYDPGTPGHTTVQEDIDSFKECHGLGEEIDIPLQKDMGRGVAAAVLWSEEEFTRHHDNTKEASLGSHVKRKQRGQSPPTEEVVTPQVKQARDTEAAISAHTGAGGVASSTVLGSSAKQEDKKSRTEKSREKATSMRDIFTKQQSLRSRTPSPPPVLRGASREERGGGFDLG